MGSLFSSVGDLLNNYCVKDILANVTRFVFACVIMLTYPIECFVAREVCGSCLVITCLLYLFVCCLFFIFVYLSV